MAQRSGNCETQPLTDNHSRPSRIADRPDPADWSEDEIISLSEAAALFFPNGPLTTHSLRTAHRDGKLGATIIARKIFTTKRAIIAMGQCSAVVAGAAESQQPDRDGLTPQQKASVMTENFRARMRDKLADR